MAAVLIASVPGFAIIPLAGWLSDRFGETYHLSLVLLVTDPVCLSGIYVVDFRELRDCYPDDHYRDGAGFTGYFWCSGCVGR